MRSILVRVTAEDPEDKATPAGRLLEEALLVDILGWPHGFSFEQLASGLVRITAQAPEYEDVHPELMLEDALRVDPHGWPQGVSIEIVSEQEGAGAQETPSAAG